MIKSEFIVDFLNKCWKTNQSEKIKLNKLQKSLYCLVRLFIMNMPL